MVRSDARSAFEMNRGIDHPDVRKKGGIVYRWLLKRYLLDLYKTERKIKNTKDPLSNY